MVPDNSLDNFTKPAIKRLAKEAGIDRLSENTYDLIREIIQNSIFKLLEKCVVFARLNKRRTIIKKDIYGALAFTNYGYVLGDEFIKKKLPINSTTTTTKSLKKTVRQKNNKLFIPCLPFERFSISLVENIDNTSNFYYAKDFFVILQSIVVIQVVNYLKAANIVAKNDERPTLMMKDLSLIKKIQDIMI